ncbi:MAG TPA: stage II sporulation protein P [Clostridia bacterium]|nr:stage II sporulation protein P [Clostridia bacterium]
MGKRRKIPRGYCNIIILLPILLALFVVPGLISRKGPIGIVNSKNHRKEALKLHEDKKIDNDFFIEIVQHTFPGKKVRGPYSAVPLFKGLSTSLLRSTFKINFSNPLTFVQAQFPVAAAHHDTLMANIPDRGKQTEEDWSKEVHFVDHGGEEESMAADGGVTDRYNANGVEAADNNFNETEEGVCPIADEDIIDSLNPISLANLENIPKPKSIKIEKNKPNILIYHTHGTESYKPITEGNYHSLKKEYTVIGAANVITEELEKKGYEVIHDTTYHDYPSYSGSYNRSATTVTSILKKNPSIRVILDIHRDGYDKIDTRKDRLKLTENSKVEINGENVARFQFVIGATSKNRKEVECFACFVKAVSDSKYPGFSKEILVKQYGSYNQYLSDYAALVELGANSNTIEEAKRAGYYFADVVADALKLLSE